MQREKAVPWLARGALLALAILLAIFAVTAGAQPATAHDCHGYSFFGIWLGAHVNTYVWPYGSGYVAIEGTSAQNEHGCDCYQTGTTITATPAAGWRFDCWWGPYQADGTPIPGWILPASPNVVTLNFDGSVNQNVLTYYNGQLNYTAHFVPEMVTIQVQAGTGFDWVSDTGTLTLPVGSVLPLEVTIKSGYQANYEFGGWVIGGGDDQTQASIDDRYSMTTHMDLDWTAFDDVGESYWVKPTLQAKTQDSFVTVTCQAPLGDTGHITIDGGATWVDSDNVTLAVGEVLEISWVPDGDDVDFVRWEVDNAGCSNAAAWNTTIWALSEDDTTVTAVVTDDEELTYTVTMAKVGNGTISPPVGTYTYRVGTKVPLVAIAAEGWVFDHWAGVNGTAFEEQPRLTHSVSGNATITATFELDEGGGGGGGDGIGGGIQGLWGRINDSLGGVGLANNMGRMFVVVAAMVIAFLLTKRNKGVALACVMGVLAIGIVGGWVPIWVVALLALGAGVFVVQFIGKKVFSGQNEG